MEFKRCGRDAGRSEVRRVDLALLLLYYYIMLTITTNLPIYLLLLSSCLSTAEPWPLI